MASIFNRSTTAAEPAEPFRMPDLAEVDAEYAKLQKQGRDLSSRLGEVRREAGAIRQELVGKPTGPAVSDAVAALLGEAPDSLGGKRLRVAELAKMEADLEQAIEITQKRLLMQADLARGKLLQAVRPEYERRARAALDALAAAKEPLKALDELRNDLARDAISTGFEWPYGVREQIAIFEKEAGHAS